MVDKYIFYHNFIDLYFACLSVCLYLIKVKKAEQIGPKFCVGLNMVPRKVYKWSKFQTKLDFWNFWNSTIFLSANFCFNCCFTVFTQRKSLAFINFIDFLINTHLFVGIWEVFSPTWRVPSHVYSLQEHNSYQQTLFWSFTFIFCVLIRT